MRIPISFAEVHADLFIQGTNLGKKLGAGTNTALKNLTLTFDTRLNVLIVQFNSACQLIPIATVLQMTVVDPKQIDIAPVKETVKASNRAATKPAKPDPHAHLPPAARAALAQVETPMAIPQTGRGTKP